MCHGFVYLPLKTVHSLHNWGR